MISETHPSSRLLKNERLVGYMILTTGLVLLIFFVLLQQTFMNTSIGLYYFLIVGSISVFIIGLFNLKEADYLIDVILSEDHLKIVLKNHKSKISVNTYDWISIKNLFLEEIKGNKGNKSFREFELRIRSFSKYTNELSETIFPLRKFNKKPSQQQLLYKHINAFWENSLVETKNLIVKGNETLFDCQICFEYYKYSNEHYTCEICSRKLCFSCYLNCRSVGKATCPNCNGNLILKPVAIFAE